MREPEVEVAAISGIDGEKNEYRDAVGGVDDGG